MSIETMVPQRAHIKDNELVFSYEKGIKKALKDGFFLLEIPNSIQTQYGARLCREFYHPKSLNKKMEPSYSGFKEKKDIYFDREHFQTEHLLVDGPGLLVYFPTELVEMTNAMNALGIIILRAIMNVLGVNSSLWSKITNGATDGNGTRWFAASHYRSNRQQLGCAPHKDTGFITILYVDQKGLEIQLNNQWQPLNPVPGYFIINFGASLEILSTHLSHPVKAIYHRVHQCKPNSDAEDRFSFATFINPSPSGDLYQVLADGNISIFDSVENFLDNFNKNTWDDRHQSFGIECSETNVR